VNPKKVHVIDPGILETMSLYITDDRGALLENIVYMHLRRQGLAPDYYVTKNGNEVDFILAVEGRREHRLIQVCWNIHDPVARKRELRALQTAMKELGLNKGTIVTWLDEEVFDQCIDIVPVWKWLLVEDELN